MIETVSRFALSPTALQGLIVVQRQHLQDERGYFIELFHEKKFSGLNLPPAFCQDNLSVSKKNVIMIGANAGF